MSEEGKFAGLKLDLCALKAQCFKAPHKIETPRLCSGEDDVRRMSLK